MNESNFEWDDKKDLLNQSKHNVSFYDAQFAFFDPHRVIAKDQNHSFSETRYYCFGKVNNNVLTVRFTYRGKKVRIIGAGYWRRGKRIYEKEKQSKIH